MMDLSQSATWRISDARLWRIGAIRCMSERCEPDQDLSAGFSSSSNPPVRFLTARDLTDAPSSPLMLAELRRDALAWEPLQHVLRLQLENGGFPFGQKTPTAQPSFCALYLMQRCGMTIHDEPVARLAQFLTDAHLRKGAVSYTGGGSGVLPCYVGIVTATLIKMDALDTPIVRQSIDWLVNHQRFDHQSMRAGGDSPWPYRAPRNFGCWEGVSCYHGVAAAFRAFAAIPQEQRSSQVQERLEEAIDYLKVHRLYKKSRSETPLFRHMTQFCLVGDYRSNLLDMLAAMTDFDPSVLRSDWLTEAVSDMDRLAPGGRVPLVKNYGRKLMDPIPLEAVGSPSRFLTYQWLLTKRSVERTDGALKPA